MSDTMTIPTVEVEFKPGARLFWGKQNVVRVLEVDWENYTALLITEKPVWNTPYHSREEFITWEQCDLRAWLNGEYYDTAFSEEEKAAIIETHLTNPDNPNYNTPGGNDTDDRIFLLSIDEAEKYFKDDTDRTAGSWWWLRSPGYDGYRAARVHGDGDIIRRGDCVYGRNGVRPAFKIDLKSEIFQSFILSESEKSIIIRVNVPEGFNTEKLYKVGFWEGIGEASMTELIAAAKKWEKDRREEFYRAYLRSDTRAAMLLAEKRKELYEYATMRGINTDELRDKYLSDLGLDMHRRKSYDLGNVSVGIRMNPDFTFTVELPDGKVSKSLPKKGADPEKFDSANKDFAQIKKDVKKIWKNRADLLLADFISGKARTAEYWKNAYGGNPILHAIACLLVWEQGGKTFRRTDDGLVTADGSAYELTDEPVRVAHPIEIEAAELEAWRKHFTSWGLKQPFAQIWERAYDPGEIAQDRYAGCPIIFFQLQGAEKHGFNQDLNIPGCKVEAKWSTETAANGNKVSYCDIQSFTINTFCRAANHALAYLDRVTIAGRIAKDDADVMRSVEGSNVAQVTEYISVAQENSAFNVLALLMEYKNTHFADFDPMDEFTLE